MSAFRSAINRDRALLDPKLRLRQPEMRIEEWESLPVAATFAVD